MVEMTHFDQDNSMPSENNPYLKSVAGTYDADQDWNKYIDAIQEFINQGFMDDFAGPQQDNTAKPIPDWIKDQARWFDEEQIANQSYFLSLKWLYQNGWLNNK